MGICFLLWDVLRGYPPTLSPKSMDSSAAQAYRSN
jgi:hypothetical protein